jgi:hypothetical protein
MYRPDRHDTNPIYSGLRAEDVEIAERFDLIWCGSLLTHLDLDRWQAFFSLLADCVADQGLFVFTAFGDWAASRLRAGQFTYRLGQDEIERILRSYDRDGFGYVDYPGEALSGMSLTSAPWMFRHLETRADLRVVSYAQRAWGGHQDVVTCMKTSVAGPR